VEQITKQLKSGTLDMDRTEGSMSTGKGSNFVGTENLKDNEQGKVALLELERSEIIGQRSSHYLLYSCTSFNY